MPPKGRLWPSDDDDDDGDNGDDDGDDDEDDDDDDVDDEVDVDALCMSECDHHISSKDTTALSSVPSHIHNKTQLYTSIRAIRNNMEQYTAMHSYTQ